MNKLDLSNLTCIESISDDHAETISAGSFTWATDIGDSGTATETFARIPLISAGRRARGIGLVNTNPGAAASSDAGHTFTLLFRDLNGNQVATNQVNFGEGVTTDVIVGAVNGSAVTVEVTQDIEFDEGPDVCFFGCNSFYDL